MESANAVVCRHCGAHYAEPLVSCPECRALRYSVELKELQARAVQAREAGDAEEERRVFGEMLRLVPEGSRQHATLTARLAPSPASRPAFPKQLGWLGALALLVWKFKWAVAFLLTKGKMLLLGLTKVQTVFSMVIALGAYWALWGWQFALGFVLSIYVHEMGHVIALRRLGIAASAPMFIPFVGAFVRLKDYPRSAHDDAEVGLAGPIYGVAAAIACYAAYYAAELAVLGGIAHAGALINLFNLIPVWQLDGGRGFNALDRKERWIATLVIAVAWLLSGEALFVLLLLGAGYRIFMTPAPAASGRRALFVYGGLVAVIALLSQIELAGLSDRLPDAVDEGRRTISSANASPDPGV